MKLQSFFPYLGFFALLSVAFFSCEKEALQDVGPANSEVQTRGEIVGEICADNCGEGSLLIDFNDLTANAPFPAEYNGVTVSAVTDKGDPASVYVFDTDRTFAELRESCAGSGLADVQLDRDLLFKDGPFGNALVIQEDGVTACANDRRFGGVVTVDFTGVEGSVHINCLTFFDTEERGINPSTGNPYSGAVLLLDSDLNLIKEVEIPGLLDGQATGLPIDADNVAFMQVVLLGSGALTGICLDIDDDPGCTYTQGRWKNKNAKDGVWTEDFDMTFGDCDEGWLDILNTPTKGNAYYILAHQYIAAYLNVKYFDADTDEIEAEFTAAGEWLNAYCADSWPEETRETAIQLSEVLDQFNNGYIGPGHCED